MCEFRKVFDRVRKPASLFDISDYRERLTKDQIEMIETAEKNMVEITEEMDKNWDKELVRPKFQATLIAIEALPPLFQRAISRQTRDYLKAVELWLSSMGGFA